MACESGGLVDAEVYQDPNHTSEGMWVNFEKKSESTVIEGIHGHFGH